MAAPAPAEDQAAAPEAQPQAPQRAPSRIYGSNTCKEEAERIQRMALALSDQGCTPPWAARYLKQAAPALGIIGVGCQVASAQLMRLGIGAYAIYQVLPKTAIKGLWGLSVCFFGGRYTVTIAAIEAFRSMGGAQTYLCVQDLIAQFCALRDANALDDEEDLDGDGIADTKQISSARLGTRKMMLALRSTDPEILSRAANGLWTAYMGVLTVLKFQFARTVALAESIADNLRPTMAKVAGPPLVYVTPPEYHKWISPVINFSCKMMAGYFAWRVQAMISTVQSGLSGGMLASRALLELLRERNYITVTTDETYMDEVLGWSLGAYGIYIQFFRDGPVPWWLSPLFWPLDIFERVFRWHVTWMRLPEDGKARAIN